MRASIAIVVVVASVPLGWCSYRPAFAAPLVCQARASYGASSPPVTVMFQTLTAGGAGFPHEPTLRQQFFFWTFGDGTTAHGENIAHTYTEPGLFYAYVTVTDPAQEVCSDTTLVLVGVSADPVCAATASTRWGDAPLSVAFDAYPVFGCGSEPFTWTWRFGDGQVADVPSPQHDYSDPGTFWAVATLHTPSGSCDCFPVLRISALTPEVVGVGPSARDGGLLLEPARPNPFGVMTTITFDLPQPGPTRLTILDVGGRTVAELVNGFQPAGRATRIWQGRSATGRVAPPGLYVARLEHGGTVRSTRLIRVR